MTCMADYNLYKHVATRASQKLLVRLSLVAVKCAEAFNVWLVVGTGHAKSQLHRLVPYLPVIQLPMLVLEDSNAFEHSEWFLTFLKVRLMGKHIQRDHHNKGCI